MSTLDGRGLRDRIVEILGASSVPLSTPELAARIPGASTATVSMAVGYLRHKSRRVRCAGEVRNTGDMGAGSFKVYTLRHQDVVPRPDQTLIGEPRTTRDRDDEGGAVLRNGPLAYGYLSDGSFAIGRDRLVLCLGSDELAQLKRFLEETAPPAQGVAA